MLSEGARELLYFLGNTNLEESLAKSDEQAANELNRRVKAYGVVSDQYALAFPELGVIALEYQKRKLWNYVVNGITGKPFSSFDDWASHCHESCRATIYAAKSLVERVSQNIPTRIIVKIPKDALYTVSQCSAETQKKVSVQKAAMEMTDIQLHAHLAQVSRP